MAQRRTLHYLAFSVADDVAQRAAGRREEVVYGPRGLQAAGSEVLAADSHCRSAGDRGVARRLLRRRD